MIRPKPLEPDRSGRQIVRPGDKETPLRRAEVVSLWVRNRKDLRAGKRHPGAKLGEIGALAGHRLQSLGLGGADLDRITVQKGRDQIHRRQHFVRPTAGQWDQET